MTDIIVIGLNEDDREQVEELDEVSGNYVADFLDSPDFVWGAFLEDKLIGYCTTGYADDCGDAIENHPQHGNDSILLSDVYILPEHRHKGYAAKMVTDALELRHQSDINPNETVFLSLLDDELAKLYEPLGFHFIGTEQYMVRVEEQKAKEATLAVRKNRTTDNYHEL